MTSGGGTKNDPSNNASNSNTKNGGFSDVEMGPLLGQATHERKKGLLRNVVVVVGDENTSSPTRGSPMRHQVKSGMGGKKVVVAMENGESGGVGGGGGTTNANTDSVKMANGGGSSSLSKSSSDPSPSKKRGGKTRGGGVGVGGNVYAGKVVFACGLYSFCSVGMVLVNKSLASSYNHLIEGDLNILLVVFQAIVAVIAVQFCKIMKWVEYPSFDLRTAREWAPVNVFFCAMLFTGMASLQYNNVPMVTVFKNITNILTAAGDRYFFGTPTELLVIASFGVMLFGACLAARNDVNVTFVGLFWMGMNCLSTSGYILYMKFATKSVKLSKFGMVFYNNVLCIVFLLPVALIMGQVKILLATPSIHTPDYFFKNFFAGFVGFFLNFASLNCVSQTGPSTYAMVGALNKIPISILGSFLFDEILSPKAWFFIAVSMLGGFLYSYAKITAGKRKAVHGT